jgi:type II secretory pathway component PulJ
MLRWFRFPLISREQKGAHTIQTLDRNERIERALGLLHDRLARTEARLEKSTGEVSKHLVAVHELASHLTNEPTSEAIARSAGCARSGGG